MEVIGVFMIKVIINWLNLKNVFFKVDISEVDLSYFVLDCFYLSEKGYKVVVEVLWNNMVIIWNIDCEFMWLWG